MYIGQDKNHCATLTDNENVICALSPFKVKYTFFFYKTSRTNNTVSITLIHDYCGGLCRGVTTFLELMKKVQLNIKYKSNAFVFITFPSSRSYQSNEEVNT